MNKTVGEVLPDLGYHTGTMNYLRHRVLGGFPLLLTDGARYVAEQAGAYWLMDTIALKARDWLLEANGFAAVELKVAADSSAVLVTTDGDENVLEEERIAFTTFPHPGLKFFLQDGGELGEPVLMLLSEY